MEVLYQHAEFQHNIETARYLQQSASENLKLTNLFFFKGTEDSIIYNASNKRKTRIFVILGNFEMKPLLKRFGLYDKHVKEYSLSCEAYS